MRVGVIDLRVDERYETQVELHALREAAERTLRHQSEEAYDLTVLITGDQLVRELSQRHRGVDSTTDVLAFINDPVGPFVDAPGLGRYLGDIIISFPQAERQAARAGNDISAELQLLVVHGVLHLLGYDHESEPEGAEMWAAQEAVLDELGLEVDLPD